jgi:hypothetical protein
VGRAPYSTDVVNESRVPPDRIPWKE